MNTTNAVNAVNAVNRKKSGRINETQLSSDTKQLIKGMIKQSKLNETQCLIMDQLIRNGACPFPSNPGMNSAPSKYETNNQKNTSSARIPIQRKPRIRMKDSIVRSGAYELEKYIPLPISMNFVIMIRG